MSKRIMSFLFFVLWVGFVQAKMLPRKILALYDEREQSQNFKDIYFTSIHRQAAMPLNYLGMEMIYMKVTDAPPLLKNSDEFRGVLIWVAEPSQLSDAWGGWLSDILKKGLKIVFIVGANYAEYVSSTKAIFPKSFKPVLEELGIEVESELSEDPVFMNVLYSDPLVMGFERSLYPKELYPFLSVRKQKNRKGKVFLRLQSLRGTHEVFEPVFITENGGIAVQPFVLYRNKNMNPEQLRWRINPFKFFEEAFELKGWPRPDTTTQNGRRMYYSHVDGDGFFNISEVNQKTWSGEVFFNEIIQLHRHSPFTLSLITAYYDLRRYQTLDALSLSKKIFSLTNVEPASHGYAHPLHWDLGTISVSVPGYSFDPLKEIKYSMDMINQKFSSVEKKAGLFLWTGNCLPLFQHLQIAEDSGYLNLNGGDSRFDSFFKSYAYVSSLSRPVGAFRQIYSSNSNENNYTGLWKGPFYGYQKVIETFENTESPMRIKPVNVYIHFYSAEKISSLKVLKKVYDWAFHQPLFPIFASEYVQWVQSFYSIQMDPLSSTQFIVKNSQHLKTIRFDQNKKNVDMNKSIGVLGFNHFQNNLYVFLDEKNEHEIVLTQKISERPYLVESNCKIFQWKNGERQVQFLMQGWWKYEVVLGGFPSEIFCIVTSLGSNQKMKTNSFGQLKIIFPELESAHLVREVFIQQL